MNAHPVLPVLPSSHVIPGSQIIPAVPLPDSLPVVISESSEPVRQIALGWVTDFNHCLNVKKTDLYSKLLLAWLAVYDMGLPHQSRL